MASALAVRIQEEGVDEAAGTFWLQFRVFFCNDGNSACYVDGVRFSFAIAATLAQIKAALQTALIDFALAQYGIALLPSEIIFPSFQRGS